ncbi:Maf family protein [Thioalkalivibrio sp. HK1]|uniref:Maf family protein n=1 Tax=Thioalkalivibrio sp. HK1 TaxID=1469245 RepID=UPI00047187BD|nr:Maf family protein [Thioalkalivibrio sp. HK1]
MPSETAKGQALGGNGATERVPQDGRRWIRLASRSPRRYELLTRIGIECEVIDAPIDEIRRSGEAPRDFVERMAREKALAGLEALGGLAKIEGTLESIPLLAADTAVVLGDRVLGKPHDIDHAREMLQALSGRMHRVISAVAVIADRQGPQIRLSESRVWFDEISDFECQDYGASKEGLDKAGAYSIQGRAAIFITRLDGSYSGVMGLPLFETAQLLREVGFLPR